MKKINLELERASIINKIKNQIGFTLIELLVVISIIALLSSIVLASINDARNRAAWRAFDSEIIQIRNAIQMYVTEYKKFPDYDDLSPLNDILVQLSDAGFYDKRTIRAPDTSNPGVLSGHKMMTDPYQYANGCGIPNDQEIYFVIWLASYEGGSEIFLPLYYADNTQDPMNDVVCVAIR